jgi:hypothetical protein
MKFWTRWRAKRALLHKYEFEAALTEWNAELSLDRGREKRKLIAKLNAEADVIEQNIAKKEATPEYQNLAGQEKIRSRPREKRSKEDSCGSSRASQRPRRRY